MSTYFSYPYPVLGNGDDIGSEIHDPIVECDISDETLKINISDLYTNYQYIDDLICDNKAIWQIRLLCPRTYVRQTYTTKDKQWVHHCLGQDFEGTVNVEIQVVANAEMPNYKPIAMHQDYSDTSFHIKPGETLSSQATYTFNVDKDYDPLKAPVSSILKIRKGVHKEGAYNAIFEEDFITVELSEKDWSEYAGIRDRIPSFLHASIVLPVIAEAISLMDRFESNIWSSRLKEIISNKEITSSSSYVIAQEILNFPLQRAFLDINASLDKG
ncbi:cupredoxin domain-containing protein [Spongorhabdus nitratireducens]